MFGAGPAAKKAKVVESSTSAVIAKPSASTSNASPALNAIPFSLNGFKEGLNEEERRLLALECDTMGKSWLKLLKDEIRKPYFLSLKVGCPRRS